MSNMSLSIGAVGLGESLKRSSTDQLLSALSRKYEEKSGQRSTPSRNTPQSREGRSVFSGRNSSLDNPSPVNYGSSGRLGTSTPTAKRAGSPTAAQTPRLSPAPSESHSSTFGGQSHPAATHGNDPCAASGSRVSVGHLSNASSNDTSTNRDADRLRFSSRHDRIVSPSAMDEEVPSGRAHLMDLHGSKDNSRRSSMSSFSQVLGSPRSSHIVGSSPPRAYMGEKDLVDAVLRKLEGENSSLRAENKALKEKYNRALSDAAQLEGKLRNVDEENLRLQAELRHEKSSLRTKSEALEGKAQDEIKAHSVELTRKLECLTIENESLLQELAASKRMADSIADHGESSKIIAAYKTESALLREEVKKIKVLLRQCEKDFSNEAELRKKALEDNKRLEDVNAVLKEQLEMDSGGTVADKQNKSIEKRLKITEERLFQERADRAGKLSEVEEKLLTENSQLQIEVRELNRYLSREREKLTILDAKQRGLKEQQMSLDFLTPTPQNSVRRYTPAQKSGTTKFSPEVAKIAEEVNWSQSLSIDNADDLIKHLHSREQAAVQRLGEWKAKLDELKELSARSEEQSAEVNRLREAADELKGRLQQTESTLYAEISKLVKEKHDTVAKLKICEDQMEGMQAELDSLRLQLRMFSGNAASDVSSSLTSEAAGRALNLQLELNNMRVQLSHAERARDEACAELEGTSKLLEAKSKSLEEAIKQLSDLHRANRQANVSATASLQASMQAELDKLADENAALSRSREQLEVQLRDAARELDESRSALKQQQDSAESHVLVAERDKLLREKHDALLSIAQMEAQLRQAASEREEQLRDAHREAKARRQELKATSSSHAAELRKTTADLDTTNRKLESKDKEIEKLLSTLQRQEQTARQLNEKIKGLEEALEDSRASYKDRMDELSAAVKEREARLAAYEQAMRDLRSEASSGKQQEARLRLLESELDDRKLKEMKVRSDLIAAEDAKNKLKEQVDKLTASLAVACEDKESSVANIQAMVDELNGELNKQQSEHNNTMRLMQNKYDRVIADLKAAEATVTAVTQTKEYLQTTVFKLEKKLAVLDQQSQEQALMHRLTEHKSESAHQESEESRAYAKAAEQRVMDMQALLSRAEGDLKTEREKVVRLQQDRHNLEAQVASHELHVHTTQKELDHAQKEIKVVCEKAEAAQQHLASKYKKQITDLKKQLSESEVNIRQLQNQLAEVGVALEEERQLAGRRQEQRSSERATVLLEERLTDALSQLKQANELLATQDETQNSMKRRNLELEVELNELRGILTRLDSSVPTTSSDPKIDNLTRAELNRTMQEWSLHLQALFESQHKDQGSTEHEHHMREQYKLKAVELEGKLKHEQLMHALTRNQLKAADEDNAKLRKLLYGGRKKKGTDDGSHGKSRAELINEKIAAAQLRAQIMIGSTPSVSSTSMYADDGAGTTSFGSLLLGSSLLATPRFERLNNSVLHNNTSFGNHDKD